MIPDPTDHIHRLAPTRWSSWCMCHVLNIHNWAYSLTQIRYTVTTGEYISLYCYMRLFINCYTILKERKENVPQLHMLRV